MTRIIALKKYFATRSNIEWSIMFISFAMVWMISGYFYQPEIQNRRNCKRRRYSPSDQSKFDALSRGNIN